MGVAETGVLKSGGVPGGSVQYVALSDIKSGKVKVPEGTQLPPEVLENLFKPNPEQEE